MRTERTRTWFDGRVEKDTVTATYQPAEGLGCDGKPTIGPPRCEDTEGLVDSDDDGFGDLCVPLEVICPADTVPVDDDDDGLIDFCDAQQCPPDTDPSDSDGDGLVDECVPRDPPATAPAVPTPAPTP